MALPLSEMRAITSTSFSADSFAVGIGPSASSSVTFSGRSAMVCFSTATGIGGPFGARAITNTVASPRRRTRAAKAGSSATSTIRPLPAGAFAAPATGAGSAGSPAAARASSISARSVSAFAASTVASSGSQVAAASAGLFCWRSAMPRKKRARWCSGVLFSAWRRYSTAFASKRRCGCTCARASAAAARKLASSGARFSTSSHASRACSGLPTRA